VNIRRSCIVATVAALAVMAAADARAGLVGSSYGFSASSAGLTTITARNATPASLSGPFVDGGPNPEYCIGPNANGCVNSGMAGYFAFSDEPAGSLTSRITFYFGGSTFSAPGSFTLNLDNIRTTDGSTISKLPVDPASVPLALGTFGGRLVDATDLQFTGSTSSIYETRNFALTSFVFDVTETASLPEPVSVVVLGAALVGLGLLRRRR
jgi:hypothetical protein